MLYSICLLYKSMFNYGFPHKSRPLQLIESAGATVAGFFLDGVVAGAAAALRAVRILCGSWKLKHSNGKSCEVNSEIHNLCYTYYLGWSTVAWDKGIPVVCIPYQDSICIIYSTVGRSIANTSV